MDNLSHTKFTYFRDAIGNTWKFHSSFIIVQLWKQRFENNTNIHHYPNDITRMVIY